MAVVLLAAGDESWQSTVPGRDPSVLDALVDVAAGAAAASLLGRWRLAHQGRMRT